MVISNNDWEAKDDAYTLVRAEEIKSDSKRNERAKKQLVKIAEEKSRELKSINKLAKIKSTKVDSNQGSYFNSNGRFQPIKLSK